jgi:hypothetical protein
MRVETNLLLELVIPKLGFRSGRFQPLQIFHTTELGVHDFKDSSTRL